MTPEDEDTPPEPMWKNILCLPFTVTQYYYSRFKDWLAGYGPLV